MYIAFLLAATGCLGDQGPASTGEVTNPDEGPSITGLTKVLQHRLRRDGLAPVDLAESGTTAAAYAVWRDAKKRSDAKAARHAHTRILQGLNKMSGTAELVEEKRARVGALLAAHGKQMAEARVAAVQKALDGIPKAAPDKLGRVKQLRTLTELERVLRHP